MTKDLIVHDEPIFANDMLVQIAKQAEARIDAVITIKQTALKVTNKNDWVDQAGKPYLQASGAEKIANLFNISWEIGKPEFELDDEMKQEVRKEMFDVNNYYKQFEGDKDNPVLFDKMFDLTAKRLFFDKVLQSAVESVINDGTVNAVKDINNVVDKSNKQPSNQKPDVQKQVLEGWKRANGLL